MSYISSFFESLARLTAEMAPYLLLGFFVAGILHVLVTPAQVTRYLGKPGIGSVIKAAIAGVPLPLCSCGVIPTGVSFHTNGASKGATTSFLISTPQTGVDSVLVTYSMLGLPFALARPVIALVTGIFGGWLTDQVDRSPAQPVSDACMTDIKPQSKVYRIFHYAFVEFMQDLAKWLMLGLGLAALIDVLIPDGFFEGMTSGSWLEMGAMLLASVPLYVCATGSVPIAAVLLGKGVSVGAVLVFLMAGPATNVATITVISKALGRKTLFAYLGSIIGGALLFGWLLNTWMPEGFFQLGEVMAHQHEHISWWKWLSAVVFTLLLLNSLYLTYRPVLAKWQLISPKQKETSMDKKVKVSGMMCNHCKANVEQNLSSIEGIDKVEADLATHEVRLSGHTINLDDVAHKVKEIGYKYEGEVA